MIVAEQQEAQSWWDLGGSTAKVEQWAASLHTGGGQSELRILTATHDRALTLANAVAIATPCPPLHLDVPMTALFHLASAALHAFAAFIGFALYLVFGG